MTFGPFLFKCTLCRLYLTMSYSLHSVGWKKMSIFNKSCS